MFKLPNLMPLVILAGIGLLALLAVAGSLVWWLIKHVRFV